MLKKILFPLFISAAVGVLAQTEKAPLKYNEYIDSVISSLPELKANGINLLAEENALKKARALSDITLTANANRSSTAQLSSDSTKPFAYVDTQLGAALTKKFTTTGTIVGVNGGYGQTGYEGVYPPSPPPAGPIDSYVYSPYIGVTLKQPLLYNFLGKVDRYTEEDAEMKVDLEKVRLIENNKMSLNTYKKLYFEWILTLKKIQNSKKSIASAQTQLNQVRRNYQAGISEEDDYQRTVATLIDYQQQLESDLIILNNIEHYLSLYINAFALEPNQDDFDEFFAKSNEHVYDFVDFSKTSSAKMLNMTMDRLAHSKGIFENRTLPELNVTGAYTRKNLTNESSEKFSRFSENDWRIGFEFVYNLGSNLAEGELKDIEIQLQSLGYEKNIAENNYKKALSNISNSAAGTKELLKQKTAYLAALQRQLATERRKYGQGRLHLSYVITTENQISATNTAIFTLKYQLISSYIDYMDAIQ
ncbi:MAG: TolC family protein [Spirochaetia bacterium]|jgi:outer membrane protein TolC|nr:TolC family protein [Spirochaetia bacterium]